MGRVFGRSLPYVPQFLAVGHMACIPHSHQLELLLFPSLMKPASQGAAFFSKGKEKGFYIIDNSLGKTGWLG